MATSDATPTVADSNRGTRHKWFPLAVICLATAWWLYEAAVARYQTLAHVLVVLFSILFVTAWYHTCGAQSQRVRRAIVWPIWLCIAAAFIFFKPVYNGDMGFYGVRPRFATRADQRMIGLEAAGKVDDWKTTSHDYPRFLGTGYWAEVHDVELETDWKTHPPQEVWRREIGAGWSGFAIVGDYVFTQEQRGEHELVTCYALATGEPVWTHSDTVRFDPLGPIGALGDIGPRATPTVHDGRVFTQGGTGIVNCLDARTGHVLWTHDTCNEFGAVVTTWGKSGSPLIVDDTCIISVGTPTSNEQGEPASAGGDSSSKSSNPAYNASLVAFDIATGKVRWQAGNRQASYATPILAQLAGERQIVIVNESYVTAHRASDGKVLWEHPWSYEGDQAASVSQPIPLDGQRLLLTKGYGVGASMLKIDRDAEGKLRPTPLWVPAIKPVMKTKFCNVVLRNGFVYGLDDVLLECMELDTGKVHWKKRRDPEFGHGQIILIGNAILVLSETGELALVEESPKQYREFGSIKALSDANVTWNTPAFSSPYLLVRNAREAACYRLPQK